MRPNKSTSTILFLLGAFSMTQVRIVGNIGISEMFVFAAAPLFFYLDYSILRRERFAFVLWFALLVCISCLISGWMNDTYWKSLFRGVMSPYSVFAWVTVLHRYLRRDMTAFKWLFVGIAVTNFLNIFAFQTGQNDYGEINGIEGNGAEIIMSNTLFWVQRLSVVLSAPILGWYMKAPLVYSIAVPVFLAAHSLFTSESGRSAALTIVGASLLILWGRKSRKRMFGVRKCFVLVLVMACVGGAIFKGVYSRLARNGALGEKALEKYERQTRMGDSILKLLMAGRVEFFVCARAALDKPVFGHGSWAFDFNGYLREYLYKYGSPEDYEAYENSMKHNAGKLRLISAHSHITGWWVWYGLAGMLFWVYVLWRIFDLFRKNIDAIPQWFGYFSLAVPGMVWTIFFSPFGARLEESLLITCVLFARAVKRGVLKLPWVMELEAQKHEND